jgi:hypothetical protein
MMRRMLLDLCTAGYHDLVLYGIERAYRAVEKREAARVVKPSRRAIPRHQRHSLMSLALLYSVCDRYEPHGSERFKAATHQSPRRNTAPH